MINLFKLSAEEFWLYIRVGAFAILTFMFLIHWVQRSKTSKAHKILGLIALVAMVIVLLFLGFDANHDYVVGPLFSLSLGLYFGFDNWYFHNYAALEEWYRKPDRQLGTFGLNTWLGKLLTRRDELTPEEVAQPAPAVNVWKVATFAMWGLFIFAMCFGFVRGMNGIALLAKYSIQSNRQAQARTQQAVDTAVKQATSAVASQINSFSESQQHQVSELRSDTKALSSLIGKSGAKADVASKEAKKAAQAAATAARRANPVIFVTPQPITTIPAPRVDPAKVKPVPVRPDARPRRLNRQVRWEEEAATDSSIFVRHIPFEGN